MNNKNKFGKVIHLETGTKTDFKDNNQKNHSDMDILNNKDLSILELDEPPVNPYKILTNEEILQSSIRHSFKKRPETNDTNENNDKLISDTKTHSHNLAECDYEEIFNKVYEEKYIKESLISEYENQKEESDYIRGLIIQDPDAKEKIEMDISQKNIDRIKLENEAMKISEEKLKNKSSDDNLIKYFLINDIISAISKFQNFNDDKKIISNDKKYNSFFNKLSRFSKKNKIPKRINLKNANIEFLLDIINNKLIDINKDIMIKSLSKLLKASMIEDIKRDSQFIVDYINDKHE